MATKKICDICGEEIKHPENPHVKAQSIHLSDPYAEELSYISYTDICLDCSHQIWDYINALKQFKQKSKIR